MEPKKYTLDYILNNFPLPIRITRYEWYEWKLLIGINEQKQYIMERQDGELIHWDEALDCNYQIWGIK